MSLIIRKECQVILDTVNLSSLHTDLSDKVLNICLEDGTVLLRLNGIKVSTSRPTKAEIAYVVELFKKFIAKKHKTISAYWVACLENQKLKRPSSDGKYFKKNPYGSAYTYKLKDETSVVFNPDTNKLQINCNIVDFSTTVTSIETSLKDLNSIIKEQEIYREKQKELQELKNKVFE